MTGRRTVLGLALLCALAFSALAAQSANAATLGTTVYTCKKNPVSGTLVGEKFKAAHCKEADTSPTGEWRHVEVPANTTTELIGTTENTEGVATPSKLESVQAGVVEQLESKLAHILPELGGVKSWITNAVDPVTGEHYYHGELWVRYTEVSVTKPAGKGCKVKTGEVTTRKLKFTTKGQEMAVKFEPSEGEVFAEFEIEGCTVAALNGLYQAKGSIKAEVDGTTNILTHASTTAQGTLSLRGQKAGFESTTTVKAKDAVDTEFTPLSATTKETP
jgi:hypothetical protein